MYTYNSGAIHTRIPTYGYSLVGTIKWMNLLQGSWAHFGQKHVF